jgi:oligoribonuclease (3'-5' exoribonuclease)
MHPADSCKMTGLDVDNDVIIEIFCIITNGNLDVIDNAGWGAVIHQSKERMNQMVRSPTTPCPEITTKQYRTSGVHGHMARMASQQQSSHQK